ncbi:MAG: diaminopimelate decarboxylase [Butyricicoccus sp.]|nr:diaminopimelate decarboxylase [Butyricicoccus sp.]
MLYDNLTINEKGHLCMAGMDTVELAREYGTPLYLMDEGRITGRMRAYKRAMSEHFGGGSLPFYASKALCCRKLIELAKEEGIGVDVVSAGELFVAESVGFPMERVCFHGSSKTRAEVDCAVEKGVGLFICDNAEELRRIDAAAARRGVKQGVILRVTPGIDPHTFAAVATGLIDSKFGLPIQTGQAKEFTRMALEAKNVVLRGFHCHIGSQIFDKQPLCDAATVMAKFAADMRDELGYSAEIIDLGGGFGVPYVAGEPVIDIDDTIRLVAEHYKAEMSRRGFGEPAVFMEPGRSIVGDSGITLYEIQDVKTIPGLKNYVAIDGGMTDDPRYALYQSQYTILLANRADGPGKVSYTVGGRCCESGDMIQEDVLLPEARVGDFLAVLTTGAYNYSMASHYNCVPKPPIVMIKDGEAYVAVRRESFREMLACQFDDE